MEIDSNLLKSYRNLLSNTKDTLAYNQFSELVDMVGVKPTKKLERSYRSLFKTIDKFSQGDMPKLLNHRFLFEMLMASPKKRERDLKPFTRSHSNDSLPKDSRENVERASS